MQADEQALRGEICRIGRDLFWMGMQTPRSGNISALLGGELLITRRGASLRALDPQADVIRVALDGVLPAAASSESPVHRAIYFSTAHRAVVHAHPPYAVALTLASNSSTIVPIHNEGRSVLGAIPITESDAVEGQGEAPEPIAAALRDAPAMMVRGHGVFCAGASLDDAFYCMGVLEAACKILWLARQSRPG